MSFIETLDRREAAEIETCFASGAWKAAYVLAGSALEQILVAHFPRRTGLPEADSWKTLRDLVAACRGDQRLAQHGADIADMLRGYRNLIWPHTVVRIEGGATRSAAAHAMTVLQKVSSTLAENVSPLEPPTAEQIVTLAAQPGITDLELHQLFATADPNELERLLLTVIPAHIRSVLSGADRVSADVLIRLRNCFDLAFCFADEDIKYAVIEAFTAALDEQDAKASALRTALFRPKYLLYFTRATQKRMLRHLLARLQNEMSLLALLSVEGLEEFFLDNDDLLVWLKAVVIASLAAPAETTTAIRDYTRRVYGALSPEQKRIIAEKQAAVVGDCEREGNHELGRLLCALHEDWTNSPAACTEASSIGA